jgi:hypothetical protein
VFPPGHSIPGNTPGFTRQQHPASNEPQRTPSREEIEAALVAMETRPALFDCWMSDDRPP